MVGSSVSKLVSPNRRRSEKYNEGRLGSNVYSQGDDDTAFLLRQMSTARSEGVSDGINGYMSMTQASLQVGQRQLWFDLEKDGLREVYLSEKRYG